MRDYCGWFWVKIKLVEGTPYLIYLGRPFVSAESDAGRIKARHHQAIMSAY